MKPCSHILAGGDQYKNGACKICAKARAKRWTAANPERRERNLRKWHGYPEPTRPQPGECELCGRAASPNKSLALDHDHETGKFRGWLCDRCNLGLGQLGDTREHLVLAIRYLDRANV